MDLETIESSSELLPLLKRGADYTQIFPALVGGDVERFFKTIWENKPCHFKAKFVSSSQYGDIYSKDKLLEIIKRAPLSYDNNMNMYKYTMGSRCNKEIKKDEIETKDLQTGLKAGYSAQFFQPQRFSDSLHKIIASFEHAFGSLAGASAYLTPSRAQGLAPHHDDVCVFIIQTEGSKLWHLWQGPELLPEHHSSDLSRDDLPGAPTKVLLQRGDVMYLPRGTIHEAVSQDEFSTHVTVSLYQRYNNKLLLTAMLEQLLQTASKKDVDFRRGLPIRLSEQFGTFVACTRLGDVERREECRAKMAALLASLVVTTDALDSAVDEIMSDFTANRLPPPEHEQTRQIEAPMSGSKRKERPSGLGMDSYVGLLDPRCCHFRIVELEGVHLVSLTHNLFHDRLVHMGHPPGEKDREDDGGMDAALFQRGCRFLLDPFL
jgi:ribosomal protein L16 Arg81 hydroxylase